MYCMYMRYTKSKLQNPKTIFYSHSLSKQLIIQKQILIIENRFIVFHNILH